MYSYMCIRHVTINSFITYFLIILIWQYQLFVSFAIFSAIDIFNNFICFERVISCYLGNSLSFEEGVALYLLCVFAYSLTELLLTFFRTHSTLSFNCKFSARCPLDITIFISQKLPQLIFVLKIIAQQRNKI